MNIPRHIIACADDMGFDSVANAAILSCFEQGYINSTSLMTNMAGFEEAVELIHSKPVIKNIGVHVNLAEGQPLTNIDSHYLDKDGNWDVYKTKSPANTLNAAGRSAFLKEINAQIDKALSQKIPVTHVDSHLHLHSLPCFYRLFLTAAKQRNLKLRLAQTYKGGSYIKYYYRKYINYLFRKSHLNNTDRFETVSRCLKYYGQPGQKIKVEIMFHPSLDVSGQLTDNYDPFSFKEWVEYLGS